ncbi:hypothetical protein SEVIR_1G283000v4 [Setaria viridis]|uniref:Uncharacterized protein n=2 Tax=Setaria TaxID=4554 RepID=A0A368PQR0_SETIT|nr:hypothetical protein SETIT_1G277500v2 [Setaria italica]TKW40975.1 hypothetical protein SEVIR_1G283000v2 [Setaria viridis]
MKITNGQIFLEINHLASDEQHGCFSFGFPLVTSGRGRCEAKARSALLHPVGAQSTLTGWPRARTTNHEAARQAGTAGRGQACPRVCAVHLLHKKERHPSALSARARPWALHASTNHEADGEWQKQAETIEAGRCRRDTLEAVASTIVLGMG